ncbi:MAG: glycoside hydrolase family 57 protein [Phycisphaerae bacterium]|nr:glycoside hydrolase family 57 protein [Phycisphaerae bacterium]
MASICFYFHVHQPFRLRRYSVFDSESNYFWDFKNREILHKVAHKCYLPANQVLLDLIRKHNGRFKVAFSVTGVILDQMEQWAPEVLDSFVELARTDCVEFVAETYYHSLAFLYSRDDFAAQVELQRQRLKDLFGHEPKVFRNTELIYNNDLAQFIAQMGFHGILAEGADHVLGYRSPTYLYHAPKCPNLVTLLKHYRLSDDIAFRFGNRGWEEWPMTAEKFSRWVDNVNGNGYVVNLFMDYETFGEHQWADTGIFDFMRSLPDVIFRHPDNDFVTPSEAIQRYPVSGEFDATHWISWADTERDLSAWLGNAMQSNALHELYRMEAAVKASGDPDVMRDWRMLQTSDHFYYMCTKYFSDGDVHKYFNPYESPYDSYINFMNVLDNLRSRLKPKGRAVPWVSRMTDQDLSIPVRPPTEAV